MPAATAERRPLLAIVYGLVNELRIFLPTFTMLCFAAAASVRLR